MHSEFYNVALDRIRYSLVWEDSTTLYAGLNIRPGDTVLVITSAGCNALNALLLGPLLYRSRLVPRILPVIGLIGAPLLIASAVATTFDLWGQVSALAALTALPIALWEFSLGIWLVVMGFKPSPFTTGTAATDTPAAHHDLHD